MRVEEQLETIRRMARRLVHPNDVDDLVQEVCIIIQANPPEHEERVVGWIRTVVRRKAVALFRREARRAEHERSAAKERPRTLVPRSPQDEENDALQLMRSAIDGLAEPYRTALKLRFYEGVPPSEISRLTGRPVQTVYTHLQRGRQHLRQRLAALEPVGGRGARRRRERCRSGEPQS